MDNRIETPENLRNAIFTYKKNGETKYGRGFYDKNFGNVAIPPDWRKFKGILLPHGFGGDHVDLKDIIEYKYCED
jgi:hypothetical protein